LILLPYKNELRRPQDSASRDGVISNTVAGPIEYAEKGDGVPLLSIHGAGGGYDQGLANVTELVGEGFRVIAPSRFGYLRTPIPLDASPAAQADAHAALLSELNISKAIVVGVSAGARSAVELAIRHPNSVAALVLIVPGTYSPTSPVSVEASRGSKFVFWLVNIGADFTWWAAEKFAPSALIRFVGVRPELVATSSKAEQDRVRSIEPLSLRFPGINLDSNPDLHPLPLEKIAAPTLIISARDDLFNTLPAAEFAASKIPGAKLIVYDTGGHLMVGRQQDVREAIRGFLAKAHLTPTSHPA
jgi:2-hydroxy-6-oxonona-2,4-dienedioate hydrolase